LNVNVKQYVPAFDHDGYIIGDKAVISKNGVEISIWQIPYDGLKFKTEIKNNTKYYVFFAKKNYLVAKGDNNTEYKPLNVNKVSKWELSEVDEVEKKKILKLELEKQIICKEEIVDSNSTKSGLIYFEPINTESIVVMCGVDDDIFKFKFRAKR
jgi:hypothetical protein